ncbi:MAG TPA: PEP/pyruvate-binding domain-containing protein, partial [Xanthobacteraceae bacterium]|nr:PEP/pyruvate-binding domain-containing protein [Xanthobacteraceae bacterium]
MTPFILPLSAPAATNAERVGPKAANLAALKRAGLPTPGGFCIAADAYRRQIQHLGLSETIAAYADADQPTQRRLAVEIRLKLYQSDLAPDLLAEVLAAWWAADKPAAVRSSALIEDRAGANFAGQFESFLGVTDDGEFLTALRACWAALW